MNILVKLPSRGRPEQLRDVVMSMMEKCDQTCQFLVSVDTDDPTVKEFSELPPVNVQLAHGLSISKIHAINRDINECEYPWDILVVASDDMWPIVQGWDTIIREAMQKHFLDLDGMLWFPDGHQKRICTMPIMGRKYYNRFRHVYHPSYRSYFCDDEQTEIAQAHGKMVYIDQQLFEHRHPDNGAKVKRDDTYRKSVPDWQRDKQNYRERKAEGFPQ